MKVDLNDQKIWSDIAVAYEKAVIKTTFYQKMMKDLMDNLTGKKRILDLGCGVGYLVNELMKQDPERVIVGVDANKYMLDIARETVIEERFLKNVTLVHGDAVTYVNEDKFDAVVSSNLMFNLKDPFAFLDNTYDNLKHGGRLVLTSAKRNPDLKIMIQSMREEFARDGRLEELKKHVGVAESVNANFVGEMKTFDNKEIEDVLLNFIGYKKVVNNFSTYLDQNFVVAAEMPSHDGEIIYKNANSKERESAFRLRYHILQERYDFIPKNPERKEKIMHDDHATHFVAVDSATGRVVGCLFYLEYKNGIGFPAEKEVNINSFVEKHEKLATPGRWYVLPTYRHRGVGKKLFELYFKTCERKKITGTVFSINPENESFFDKLGAMKVGGPRNDYKEFHRPAPSQPVYIDMTNGIPAYFKSPADNRKNKTFNLNL